jgi:hypothetical protein
MSLKERVINNLYERRDRVLQGLVNSIPSPFARFSEDFVGIEQSCYYAVTSFTKGAKSQLTSYLFIYNTLLYCYYNNKNIKVKIIYFPLEETPERILQRFISYLLFIKSDKKIRVAPRDLRSTTEAVSEDILKYIEDPEISDILKYFEENVIFPQDCNNPTGIYKWCKQYAEDNGTVYTKPGKYKNEFGETVDTQVFDRYEQNDPNEYRLIIIDTINLIDTERGMSLKESMDKLSEYLAKYLRNRYHYSPVVIQQQAFSGESNDAVKLGRISPSISNLGDSKYISRDANIVLGLFSPFKFSLREYYGYDITKFKDNIRFLEVLVNRDGAMGGICPLYFDGATCFFKELPKPNDTVELNKIYNYLNSLNTPVIKQENSSMLFFNSIKSKIKLLINYKLK